MSDWKCGRCGKPADGHQGHYWIHPRCAINPTGFHMCCPEPDGCELTDQRHSAQPGTDTAASDPGTVTP